MKRITVLLMVASIALGWGISRGQDHEAPATPPDFAGDTMAQRATERFEALERGASQRYDAEVEEASRQYIVALKSEQIQQVRKHNDALAKEMGDVIDQLEAESAEYKKGMKEGAGHKEMSIDLGNGIKMKFVRIPAGEFLQGSPNTEPHRGGDETQHKVRITHSFYMGVTHVTQAQYAAVTGNNPSRFKGEDLPVEYVNWEHAVEYCKQLSQKVGKICRLPTEAEWEYAAHAGTQGAFVFGDDVSMMGDYAWYGANSGGTTHPVGQKKPNAWGLYDMQGNLWQWCSSYWEEHYPEGEQVDPQGPAQGTFRVMKGGAWETGDPYQMRIAMRLFRYMQGHYNNNIGFRVVMESQ